MMANCSADHLAGPVGVAEIPLKFYLTECRQSGVPDPLDIMKLFIFGELRRRHLFDGYLMKCDMRTDTSERGPERLICAALAEYP